MANFKIVAIFLFFYLNLKNNCFFLVLYTHKNSISERVHFFCFWYLDEPWDHAVCWCIVSVLNITFIYILSAERFFKYKLLVWNWRKIFFSTVNISLAKVAITTEFVLATSEVYSPMANVVTFSANTDAHSLGIQYNTKNILPLDESVRVIIVSLVC